MLIILQFLNNLEFTPRVFEPFLDLLRSLCPPFFESFLKIFELGAVDKQEVAIRQFGMDFLSPLQINIQDADLNKKIITLPLLIISLSLP